MARGVDQAEHWRTRATLLDLARTYDDMAARAERTARTRHNEPGGTS